jgi:hypothetical protein
MNDKDQNLAVAKIHGWEEIQHNPKTGLWYGKPPKDAAHPWDVVVPDYGKDLNAMHRVEAKIQHYGAFVDVLAMVMKQPKQGIIIPFATASQRREALLRCLNLWTED